MARLKQEVRASSSVTYPRGLFMKYQTMVQRLKLDLRSPKSVGERPKQATAELVHVLLRQKRTAIATFIVIMLLAAVATLLATPTYRSEAKLFVRLGRENATLDPTATLGRGVIMLGSASRETEISSVADILRSRLLLEKVVDAVGPAAILGTAAAAVGPKDAAAGATSASAALSREPEQSRLSSIFFHTPRDAAIIKLFKGLRITPVPRSSVVTISYDGYAPATAQAIVAKLVDSYVEQHVQLNRTRGAHEFLVGQTETLRAELAKGEAQLYDLMNEKGVVSTDGRREALVRNLSQLETALREATAAAAATEAQIKDLTVAMERLPKVQVADETSGIADGGTDMMRGQLYGLQLKEQELLTRYTEQYPELRQIRQQVAAAKATLAQEDRTRNQVSKHPDQTHKEGELTLLRENATLASHRAKIEVLHKQLAEVRGEMKDFNDTDLRLRRLRREIDLQEAKYRKYADNLDQARIDAALEMQRISNISVAQPATYEAPAVYPRPLVNLALALAGGLIGAIALAYAAEYAAHVASAREAEKRPRLAALLDRGIDAFPARTVPASTMAVVEKEACS